MIRFIKHRAYQMIEATVHTYKNCCGSLFDHICLHYKITCFTYKIFTRLKPHFEFSSIFFFVMMECFANFFTQCNNIGFYIIITVRNFVTAAEINELELWKMASYFKHHFKTCKKNIDVFYFTSGMHVQTSHMKICCFYNSFDMTDLVNGNAKLAINMTR